MKTETNIEKRNIHAAITVRWLKPTNTQGSRLKASCQRGSVTVSWNYGLSAIANRYSACAALLEKILKEDRKKYGQNSTGWGSIEQWHENNSNEERANAHLMAAAPELLEALQGFFKEFPWTAEVQKRHPNSPAGKVLSKARAAIAKATGEGKK